MTAQLGSRTQYGGWRPRGVSMKRKTVLLVASGLLVLAGGGVATAAVSGALGDDKPGTQSTMTGDPIGFHPEQSLAITDIQAQLAKSPDTNAGAFTDGKTGSAALTVNVVDGAQLDAKSAASLEAGRKTGITITYRTVPNSQAELDQAQGEVCGVGKYQGVTIQYCAVDPRTDLVEVQIPVGSGVKTDNPRVHMIEAEPLKRVHAARYFDTLPVYGSALIAYPVSGGVIECSSAMKIFNKYGEPLMLTAGHCSNHGQNYWTSNPSGALSSTYIGYNKYDLYGSLVCSVSVPCMDIQAIGNTSTLAYGPKTWIGVGNSTTWALNTNVAAPYYGQQVYVDGAITGQAVQGTVQGLGYCYTDEGGKYICNNWDVWPNTGGITMCQGGDSGGPVFGPNGHGGLIQVGIFSALDPGANVCTFTALSSVLTKWQSTLALN